MEREDWHERDRGYRHPQDRTENYINDDRPLDPDVYRGAYRLDTTSDHRNISTWDGFNEMRNRPMNQPLDHGRYQGQYGGYQNPEHENRARHNSDDAYNRQLGAQPDQQRIEQDYGYGRGPGSNFNNDNGPDSYPHRPDENYGNMAGSLSYGYDGDRNSNPDADRYFNPLSGRIYPDRNCLRHRAPYNRWYNDLY